MNKRAAFAAAVAALSVLFVAAPAGGSLTFTLNPAQVSQTDTDVTLDLSSDDLAPVTVTVICGTGCGDSTSVTGRQVFISGSGLPQTELNGTLVSATTMRVTLPAAIANQPGTYTVTLVLTRTTSHTRPVGDGTETTIVTETDTSSTQLQILPNDPPVADPGGPYVATVGTTIVLDGSSSHDPDGDTLTYAWDLDNDGNFTDSAAEKPSFGFGSVPGTVYSVCLRVSDPAGRMDTKCTTVMTVPANHPPAAAAGADQHVGEGDVVTLDGSASSDPDGDALTYSWTQTGGPAVTLSDPTAAKPTFTPPDNGVYSFRLTVDDGTATSSDDMTVNAENVAPAVQITGPAAGTLTKVGDPVTFTGAFTDRGRADTHAAKWSFDSLTTDGAVTESSGSGTVSATYTFAAAGVYQVELDVTDDDGGLGSATRVSGNDAYIVVYDPGAGFVTGGGWINSPAGAYRADMSLAGRANFGFVSRYQKGANVPSGETEFNFQVAGLKFHSDAYQWLVVAGAKAQYKGTGSVNGASGYGFLLTATDGDISGGGGIDKFRIKIWNVASGNVVYDNVVGSDDIDTANPQAIGGGSIVIHS